MRCWDDVVDPGLAYAQETWEDRQQVRRVHEAGMSIRDIATLRGVSTECVYKLHAKALLQTRSPIERYFAQTDCLELTR